jgi:hypothetical protein
MEYSTDFYDTYIKTLERQKKMLKETIGSQIRDIDESIAKVKALRSALKFQELVKKR